MMSAEEKANVKSDSSSKADDATENSTIETNISSPIMLSVKETVVLPGSTDIVEHIEGPNDEEKAVNNAESDKEEANEEGENDEANEESENEEAEVESDEEEEPDEEIQTEQVSYEENAVSEEANEENASEGEGEKEVKENEGNLEKLNTDEVDVKPKVGGRKPRRKSRKKKIEQKGSEIVKVNGDKPESSNKKVTSKKVEGMGMIFMCSSKTKTDCFRYKVLGLPAGKKDQVQKIYKGMRLFLFDIDLRLMYGIFKAAAPGGYNIEPKAFKSAFPSQVRFTIMEDCLPLAEEKFKKVLKENYYSRNKFNCQLTSEQVKKLCKLFTVARNASTSKAPGGRSRKAETRAPVEQGRRGRRAREEERHPERRPVSRREEHRYRERTRSPPRRLARLPPPAPAPAPAPAPVYVYERPIERDPYMRDPVLEHRGLRYIDSEPRRREEIRVHEPYIVYEEAPSYRDSAYSTSRQLEYAPPQATLPLEYRQVSREYHSDAGRYAAAYHFPGLLQPEYRAVEQPTTTGYFHAAASSLPEYQSRRTIYRY